MRRVTLRDVNPEAPGRRRSVVERHAEVVVVGAGVGGLVAAGLLARSGRGVVLLEAHDKPGGSASWYEAGGFRFDAGATTLIGMAPGDPLAVLLEVLGVPLGAASVDGVDVHLPDRRFLCGSDDVAWEAESARALPGAGPFLARVSGDAARLWQVSRRWPALPITGPRDLLRNARLLSPDLLPLLPTLGSTVADVARRTGAPDERGFRAFVDLSLLITVQSPASLAPWWNGALGLDLFRRGVSRARGGMRSLAEGLLLAARRAGAETRLSTVVTRLRRSGGLWRVRTAAGDEIAARYVVANVPLHNLPSLLEGAAPRTRSRLEDEARRVGEGWGALVLNLGLSREIVTDPRRLHHLVLRRWDATPGDGESLFLSFSPPGDPVAPAGGQTLSVSTHVPAAAWTGLRGAAYREAKAAAVERMRGEVTRLFPGLASAVAHGDLGTPRTFLRYTRRRRGSVGGLRISLANSGLRAVDPGLGLPDFQLVGDTAFPGQGTLAVALSGALAAERLGAVRLGRDGSISFRGGSG